MKLKNCLRIVIEEVQELEIPRYIGERVAEMVFAEKRVPGLHLSEREILPANIRRRFRESRESSVRHRGRVYSKYRGHLTLSHGIQEYTCSKDITERARGLLDESRFYEYLEWLRDQRGIELDTLELFEQLGARKDNFAFIDRDENSRIYGQFDLQFQADYNRHFSNPGFSLPNIVVPLAEVKYKRLKR
jgi:hypothetical protein